MWHAQRARSQVVGTAQRMCALFADVGDAARRTGAFARELDDTVVAGSVLRRVGLTAAAAGDELLLTSFRQLHAPATEGEFATSLDEARALLAHFERVGVLDAPEMFHDAPVVPVLHETSARVARVRFGHATFASQYRPDPAVPGATRYAEHTRNETVHAWLLRQPRRAPWIVCVHGAGMGNPLADIVAFRAVSLHRAGFNVAIPVLPHHGPRGAGRLTLAFPSDDPAGNLHGVSQAIADVRAVLAYVAAQGERAALFGISLGGYVAASVAALEPAVCGVILGVPVVDIPDLLRTHAPPRFAHHPRFDDLYDVARELDAVTSPLGLAPPTISVQRVWAGQADRLVRPAQIAKLVEHWSLPEVSWFSGGHVGFFAARSVRLCVADALVDGGVAERRDGRLVAAA